MKIFEIFEFSILLYAQNWVPRELSPRKITPPNPKTNPNPNPNPNPNRRAIFLESKCPDTPKLKPRKSQKFVFYFNFDSSCKNNLLIALLPKIKVLFLIIPLLYESIKRN